MRPFWLLLGRISFWCSWPATWVYLHGTHRSRVLIVNSSGDVLVVKGWLGLQRWSLPGGGIHGDEDPKLAAVREAVEETGVRLQPEQLEPLAHQALRSKGFVVDTYLFAAKVPESPVPVRQRFEIIEAAWVKPSTLNDDNSEPDVALALQAWSR